MLDEIEWIILEYLYSKRGSALYESKILSDLKKYAGDHLLRSSLNGLGLYGYIRYDAEGLENVQIAEPGIRAHRNKRRQRTVQRSTIFVNYALGITGIFLSAYACNIGLEANRLQRLSIDKSGMQTQQQQQERLNPADSSKQSLSLSKHDSFPTRKRTGAK